MLWSTPGAAEIDSSPDFPRSKRTGVDVGEPRVRAGAQREAQANDISARADNDERFPLRAEIGARECGNAREHSVGRVEMCVAI